MKKTITILLCIMLGLFCTVPAFAEQGPATPTDLQEAVTEPAAEPVQEEEAAGEPEVTQAEAPDMETRREGIMLKEDLLYDAPDGTVIAAIPAGSSVGIFQVKEGWIYAEAETEAGMLKGYIRKDAAALYNEKPGEEENIRAIVIGSNIENLFRVKEGTKVILTAELIGFENDAYTLQWQYSPDNGATAVDIPGATGIAYGYILNRNNFGYVYRLIVTYEPDALLDEQ